MADIRPFAAVRPAKDKAATSRFYAINVTAFSVYKIYFIFARLFLDLLYFFQYTFFPEFFFIFC